MSKCTCSIFSDMPRKDCPKHGESTVLFRTIPFVEAKDVYRMLLYYDAVDRGVVGRRQRPRTSKRADTP